MSDCYCPHSLTRFDEPELLARPFMCPRCERALTVESVDVPGLVRAGRDGELVARAVVTAGEQTFFPD